MTALQIKYFLTAARCLNFTEAAKQLYISQSALSQQITAMENELNIQLFVRAKRKVFLTPAAVVLMNRLPKYEELYDHIIQEAKYANEGNRGLLRIGFLEGQRIATNVIENYFRFVEKYPNVAIEPCCASFGELKRMLAEDEVDMIYTVDFEIAENQSYIYEPVAEDYAVVLLSKYHPLAKERITSLSQLRDVHMITLRSQDSEKVTELVEQDCRAAGFVPRMRFARSLSELTLLVEMGLGFGVTNQDSYGCLNENLIFLEGIRLGEKKFVFGWKKTNINPAIALFINSMRGKENDK